MSHGKGRLTVYGRSLVVRRVLVDGWRPALAAEAAGVSRATVYKWLRRYRDEGDAGLEDRSSAPHRRPRALPRARVARILRLRLRRGYGPHRLAALLHCPRSTVYSVLRRHGRSRLCDLDRPTKTALRYVRERPGELLHVDVKKLGRIPDGGGWRVHGRSEQVRGRGIGYDYLHVAVDDCSRFAVVGVYPDERGETASAFLREAAVVLAAHGVRVERGPTAHLPTLARWPSRRRLQDSARGTSSRAPTDRRPTARRSASTAPWSRSGRTLGPTPRTSSGSPPCPAGSPSTIDGVLTLRSAA